MQKLFKPLLYVKTKTGYSIFTIVVVTLFSAWMFYDATKVEVVVAEGGENHVVKTHVDTVGEVLDDLGIDVGTDDELSHERDAAIVEGMQIDLMLAHNVVVVVDGEIEEYITTANTVGEFFEEKNFSLSRFDNVSHSNIQLINKDLQIDIEKAFSVIVKDGGEEVEVMTTGGTVEEVLAENDLSHNEIDKIEPALQTAVEKDTVISIVRVEEAVEVVEEVVPFQTEEKQDSSLKKGTSKVLQEGKEGAVVRTYDVVLENGEEVERELVEEEITEESVTKVVAIGTKVVQQAAAKNKSVEPAVPGQTYTMEATAYSPYCKGCSGTSAAGVNLRVDPMPRVIAVDPRVIPLGSKVWVEGYGEAIAADTGGAIKGHRVDVLLPKGQTSNWGRKQVKVKVLD